jgi:hypothetical protein
VRHVSRACFRCAVRGRGHALVGAVGGHGSGEEDGTFDVLGDESVGDESAGGDAGAVEGAEEVDGK